MAQIKAKITSKENMANIRLPGIPEFIPLEVVRDEKSGKVKESKGEVLIEESQLGDYQALGKKYGFTIKRA